MKLIFKIIYNGTRYSGYQAQHDRPSVQSTLTEAVSKCFGKRFTVTGCSRTDAGVHALGFVVAVEPFGEHEENWLSIPVGRVHRALSQYLPDDISVIGEAIMPDDFHPRYSASGKTYIYKMYDAPYEDPFLSDRAWHLKRKLDDDSIEKMNRAACELVGKHDFTSFMATGSKITDAKRTIKNISIRRNEEGQILLSVTADGFLYNMVRIITGTLVDIGLGTIPEEEIPNILAACDRTKAGRTAPAHGLYLEKVFYDDNINWVCE